MAKSTYSPRNLSQQKYRKEIENLKTLGWEIKPRMSMIPRKKHPRLWHNISDVLRGSMSTDEFCTICWKEEILPRNL